LSLGLVLAAGAGATALASTGGGLVDHALSRLQGPAHHAAQNMKSFGKDFDSGKALKTSQAAIGHTLTGYTLHDRRGRIVRLADFRGRPLVVSLIYTSCFHICPTTTQNLARAARAARSAVGKGKFTVATIGFDVLHDTSERMGAYARQQGVSREPDWMFLSTDKATITRLATDLGFFFVPSAKGFDHLIQTTIVDADGKIYRQIYGMDFNPGLLTETMKELVFGRSLQSLSLSALVNKVRLYCTHYDPATGTYQFNYGMVFGMGFGVFVLTGMGIFLVRFWRHS